jgi:hypothetical protein
MADSIIDPPGHIEMVLVVFDVGLVFAWVLVQPRGLYFMERWLWGRDLKVLYLAQGLIALGAQG